VPSKLAVKPCIFDGEKRAKFEAEVSLRVKQVIFKEFNQMINRSNGLDTYPPTQSYKFFIGKGNNNSLIK
jgi:hypothetical protein